MDHYIGTKTLKARPMTRGEYNDYREWTIPDDDDPNEAGYLVEYEDGGKANDARHDGYISWSPADVFEKAYRKRTMLFAEPHQQRVVDEKDELDERIEKLESFISSSPIFAGLPEEEKIRLQDQCTHMMRYSITLSERIKAFPVSTSTD